MQRNIENDRAARLASEERLARERAKPRAERQRIAARLLALGDEMSRLPVLDDRPGDEILYDTAGLPKGRDAA